MKETLFFLIALFCLTVSVKAQGPTTQKLEQTQISSSLRYEDVEKAVLSIEPKMLQWRRDFHEHPELSNREFRTAKVVAEHLKKLGLEVKTGVAHTGVVALLKGAKRGKVVALRADLDALPVKEVNDLSFASKAKGIYRGAEIDVMHACGHDCHVAILMAVAEVLSGMKNQLKGDVKFIFQPSEEGAPDGEEGGAELMIKEGVLENPEPDAIFGLHVMADIESGKISYRSGPTMAAVDWFDLTVKGKQTHGATPWTGIDPIVISSQIIMGLQTIESRQVNVTAVPSIITVGSIHGGLRYNIIPDSVHMMGTVRSYDEEMQEEIHRRIINTSEHIAQSAGAKARVTIRKMYPATVNHPELTEIAVKSLERRLGKDNIETGLLRTGAEDFSFYQKKIPGFFYFLGVTPKEKLNGAPQNHSPLFMVDESALKVGVQSLIHLTIDYLNSK
ncbi:MAG: amidohydrolase [Chloroherpetonaceae bacterium]|nr:amidohydrolase [Chloroherpetonaceae bacterium]